MSIVKAVRVGIMPLKRVRDYTIALATEAPAGLPQSGLARLAQHQHRNRRVREHFLRLAAQE